MNKAIYITSNDSDSGKSILTIGIMNSLLRSKPSVGYFRPIIDDTTHKRDNHINTVLTYFSIDIGYEDAYGYPISKLIKKWNNDKKEAILNTIIKKYKKLEERFDFVIVEGSDFSDLSSIIELDLNILIAKNLGIPVIIISSALDKRLDDFADNLHLTYDSFIQKDVNVIATVANKVEQNQVDTVKEKMKDLFPKSVIANVIPIYHKLKNPTMKELVDYMNADILFGSELLDRPTGEIEIGAMQLQHFLEYLTEDAVIVTPADREDILMGTLQANISTNYPSIAGIILSGKMELSGSIIRLIDGLDKIIPIVRVKEPTFNIASQLANVRSHIYSTNTDKIKISIDVFERHIDVDRLMKHLESFEVSKIMTPRMFQYYLVKRAMQVRKHIVLPEGNDDRILIAASKLQELDIIDLTLLGVETKIKASVERLNIPFDFDKASIINPNESEYLEDFTSTLYELRKHKGLSPATAEDLIRDVSYFGTMMVYKGLADGMVSGAIHTTQHTIRPALQFIKTKPGFSVVSSIFFMCLEDRVSVFGDCAINPNPTAEQLADIAIASADSSIAFGIDAKVAMLSYSSGVSGQGEDVDTVKRATAIVREKRPDLKVEGPIQYDAAVDPEVGRKKLPYSEVAGQASVLIFPDLNTGNNTYKAVQRETGALAIGPMLQGLNKPINDLSRGCTVDDIFNTVIITAIQAQD
ncbi:phosphate acetyltransferase [Winogradskyella alexanderae]|uniref:Phosphate acetyltransferase n=1 Tax=Winogradskyella alexanderae TaxID=2877123 RepID=A0ABS7XVQ4_9FLAO|nr:phosphate acetyltransferase [Winogradskyella alexanderae]MCA0133559.1 phosphate acetyltransferase [Winogradskyella alexanderae]